MMNKRKAKTVLNSAGVRGVASERRKLIETMAQLQTLSFRFVPLVSRDSVGLVAGYQAALKSISDDVSYILAYEQAQKSRCRSEIWENEGGRVLNVSI